MRQDCGSSWSSSSSASDPTSSNTPREASEATPWTDAQAAVEGMGVLDGVADVGPRSLLEASPGVGDALAELSEAHLGDRGQE